MEIINAFILITISCCGAFWVVISLSVLFCAVVILKKGDLANRYELQELQISNFR